MTEGRLLQGLKAMLNSLGMSDTWTAEAFLTQSTIDGPMPGAEFCVFSNSLPKHLKASKVDQLQGKLLQLAKRVLVNYGLTAEYDVLRVVIESYTKKTLLGGAIIPPCQVIRIYLLDRGYEAELQARRAMSR